MAYPVDSDKGTPVQVAKVIGCQPQKIYGLVKSGRVHNYAEEGQTTLVDEDEVRTALVRASNKTASDGKKKKNAEGVKPVAKKGDIVGWKAGPKKVSVGIVTAADELLTEIKVAGSDVAPFSTESLNDRFRRGQVVFLPRNGLINTMLAQARARHQEDDLLDSLEYVVESLRAQGFGSPKDTRLPAKEREGVLAGKQ